MIDADGHAWLWRLIADAGTAGRGSYEGKARVVRDGRRASR